MQGWQRLCIFLKGKGTMKILAFDLSSSCIGCACGDCYEGENGVWIEKLMTASIIPPHYVPSEYLKSKKNLICNGHLSSSWAKPGETKITKTEQKRRNVQVRNEKDVFVLASISQEIDQMISAIHPGLILVEKNEIFNGVLTSILLAKIMGVLHGVAGTYQVPIKEYRVQEVRAPYDVFQLVAKFVDGKSQEDFKNVPDVTKRAIRVMLEGKYNIKFCSDDESDAALVLDYYINHATKKQPE